jgi:GH15 family glucan-1,4-alpha-glucosidase
MSDWDVEDVSFEVNEGEEIPFVLTYGPSHLPVPAPIDPALALQETEAFWNEWCSRCTYEGEHRDLVMRSLITLKALTYGPTGGIVAAPTTSLPEKLGGSRNWDYRFCWLRDAFFVVRALNSLSEVGTMEDYLRWLYDVLRGAETGHVQPLYGIGLEQTLPEAIVSHLPGYRDMGPVRVGNQAYEHFQHDVYGNIVLGAAQAFFDHRLFRRADARDFAELEGMGEQAWRLHDQPDAGMWELRTRARVHTSSSLMCWAACDRLAKIAVVFGEDDRHALWRSRADQIRATILARAWSEKRQAFAESFGGNELDASVLLMAEVGFIEPRDPRFVKTIEALEATLCDGPFMRRYEAISGKRHGSRRLWMGKAIVGPRWVGGSHKRNACWRIGFWHEQSRH